jgi:hydroxyacylglutathione hydrolase
MKSHFKYILMAGLLAGVTSCKVSHQRVTDLNHIPWIHGGRDCKNNPDPAIQVVSLNSRTWILRQNKCTNFEGPFLFLFCGLHKALLVDTGATADEDLFPLRKTVTELIGRWEKTTHKKLELIVAHTHSHDDHTAGDGQFKDNPNTAVVGLTTNDVISFFKFQNWPFVNSKIALGQRTIEIIPIPGHQKSSIAFYDSETKVLLTGDTFYPGRLYVDDWNSYTLSIQRLVDFTKKHPVSYLLGNHIEMTTIAGKDYPMGTTYQPEEHILPLSLDKLYELNEALRMLGQTPKYEVHDDFIIYPK